ncbi:MAG: hypothetical protein LBQ39_08195 [Tannerellaceae bacterium]|jgi:spore germination protein YaaH|nr:hypothetical protein [Tannerellaceae bacterium]
MIKTCLKIVVFFLCLFVGTVCCSKTDAEPKTENSTPENPTPDPDTEKEENYVVAYLIAEEYASGNVRWDAITHLNVSFLFPNEDGTLSDASLRNNIAQIVSEAHKHQVKVIVSMRDAAEKQFANAIIYNKSKLADNLLKYVEKNNLDGFDIDFEDWSVNNVATHLLLFSKELHDKKKETVLQTCAVNTWDRGYTKEWHTYYDIINVMSYDWHGPWNSEGQHAPFNESIQSIEFWKKEMGAPAGKLTLGLPFYGYSWNKGDAPGTAYRYSEILTKYPDKDVHSVDQIDKLYYNGKATIERKCLWAKENKIGGVMIWQIGQDAKRDEDSLLKAIGNIMLEKP